MPAEKAVDQAAQNTAEEALNRAALLNELAGVAQALSELDI